MDFGGVDWKGIKLSICKRRRWISTDGNPRIYCLASSDQTISSLFSFELLSWNRSLTLRIIL